MWLTYSFLLSWVGGGITLLAMLVLRTMRRPYALAIGAIGYGAVGFICSGLGLQPHGLRALAALGGAVVGAGLGYGLGRLGRGSTNLPLDLR